MIVKINLPVTAY